jgi:nucleotide-binding universal stress UspA family protein
MKIIVANDGSECSLKAVHSVANRPWPTASQFRVISVVQLITPEDQATMPAPFFSEYSKSLLEQIWKEARTRAEEAVADAAEILRGAQLDVCDCKGTPVGEPRSVLLDEAKAWGADLVVVGSYGRHGFERMMLGSVSEAIELHAHCSVEVIRR